MTAKEIILNIAVNMSRLSRFASEGRKERLNQFLKETDEYLQVLETTPKSQRVKETLRLFEEQYKKLKTTSDNPSEGWAEDALTWGNILTHRAKLAD